MKTKQKFILLLLVFVLLLTSVFAGCTGSSDTPSGSTSDILAGSTGSTPTESAGSASAVSTENPTAEGQESTPADSTEPESTGTVENTQAPGSDSTPADDEKTTPAGGTPTKEPATPTAKPTAASTEKPTSTSTAKTTATPTPTQKPTATPTAKPTATPTPAPTPFEFEKRNDYLWMTYNIKTQNGSTLESVPDRAAALCDFLKRVQPDIVGMQEATRLWRENLTKKGSFTAEYYNMIGEERNNTDTDNEANPILYRKDRFELLDSGTFWLSETPDVMSKGFGADYYRICTWAKLKDKNSGQVFVFMNTHLDTSSKKVRTAEFNLICEKAQSFGNIPVILTGDFNMRQDAPLYETIKESMFTDSKTIAKKADDISSKVAEYYDKSSNKPIDFVYVTDHWKVSEYHVDPGEYKGRSGSQTNISDHCAVYIRATVG